MSSNPPDPTCCGLAEMTHAPCTPLAYTGSTCGSDAADIGYWGDIVLQYHLLIKSLSIGSFLRCEDG